MPGRKRRSKKRRSSDKDRAQIPTRRCCACARMARSCARSKGCFATPRPASRKAGAIPPLIACCRLRVLSTIPDLLPLAKGSSSSSTGRRNAGVRCRTTRSWARQSSRPSNRAGKGPGHVPTPRRRPLETRRDYRFFRTVGTGNVADGTTPDAPRTCFFSSLKKMCAPGRSGSRGAALHVVPLGQSSRRGRVNGSALSARARTRCALGEVLLGSKLCRPEFHGCKDRQSQKDNKRRALSDQERGLRLRGRRRVQQWDF